MIRQRPLTCPPVLDSFREQQRDAEAKAPVRPAGGRIGVIAVAGRETKRLAVDLQHLVEHHVDGYRPLTVHPVVRGFGVHQQRSVRLRGVPHERLQERGIDVLAVARAGEGPDVVGQHADRPSALLLQGDRRRTRARFLCAECLRPGGIQEHRALHEAETCGIRTSTAG